MTPSQDNAVTPLRREELRETPERWEVTTSATVFEGKIVDMRQDTIRAADGSTFSRDVIVHPGAVGIIAVDDDDRVLLLRQYRHPVGHRLVEPPAGLMDVADEPPLETAQRELLEEAHILASDWRVLVDTFTSPGMSTECVRIFLARQLSEASGQRHEGEHEEADMSVAWADLDDLVAQVLSGRLHNAILVAGVLAAVAARAGAGWDALRPADAPWPARDVAQRPIS